VKPWTGFALLGQGWFEHRNRIAPALHEYYHAAHEIDEVVGPDGLSWWPIVDAVVAPGLILKKQELMEQASLQSKRHCAWSIWCTSTGGTDSLLRPFAIARAFLQHYISNR